MRSSIFKVNSIVDLVTVECQASIRSISVVRFVLKAELSGILGSRIKLSLVASLSLYSWSVFTSPCRLNLYLSG